MRTLNISTKIRSEMVDITGEVNDALRDSGVRTGVCQVFIPHTTAGVTINENTDPDVRADIIRALDAAVPWRNGYRHAEGNSAAHVKASLTGFSAMIPIEGGRLALGTWQAVYFCEFDGPRSRTVIVNIMGSE